MATDPPIARSGGYEKTDASPRGLVYFALIMAGILALTSLSLVWVFKYFQKVENPASFVAAPFTGAEPVPPPPRIQSNPAADIQSYLESQQKALNTYGWIDRQNGIVRLPIDRAMDLLLQRGLPTRPANAPENGTVAPTPNGPANSAGPTGVAR